jgi:hypothetical protein
MGKSPADRESEYGVAKAAFDELQAAEATAAQYRSLILQAVSQAEVERLTGLLVESQREADAARERFMAAARVFAASL